MSIQENFNLFLSDSIDLNRNLITKDLKKISRFNIFYIFFNRKNFNSGDVMNVIEEYMGKHRIELISETEDRKNTLCENIQALQRKFSKKETGKFMEQTNRILSILQKATGMKNGRGTVVMILRSKN